MPETVQDLRECAADLRAAADLAHGAQRAELGARLDAEARNLDRKATQLELIELLPRVIAKLQTSDFQEQRALDDAVRALEALLV